jgi:hypothetical protein
MVTLIELPTELLRLVLQHLADINLCAFFTARRTCRAVQTTITDIIDKTFLPINMLYMTSGKPTSRHCWAVRLLAPFDVVTTTIALHPCGIFLGLRTLSYAPGSYVKMLHGDAFRSAHLLGLWFVPCTW